VVHLSKELEASSKYSEHRSDVDNLVEEIKSGGDLTPHLSREVVIPYIPKGERKLIPGHRGDLDRLQADWGIHHLHLSSDVEGDGFVKRNEDLLFAVFRANDAFVIGIFDHHAWINLELVRICIENWPNEKVFLELQGFVGLTQHFSDADRLSLRNAGVTTPIEIGGKLYMPPGQSTAGTPNSATDVSNQIMWGLKDLRRTLDDPEKLGALLGLSSVDSSSFTWAPRQIDGYYGLYDEGTNTFLRVVVVPW
jgi:hypothetical protein